MANKIGIVLALDGEQKFTQGMKNAQQSAKMLDSSLKSLETEDFDFIRIIDGSRLKPDAFCVVVYQASNSYHKCCNFFKFVL